MTAPTLHTLYEVAGTWETLHARLERGQVTAAEVTARLAPMVGVDERGRRWTVSAAGQWVEVGADGVPLAKGAPKATDYVDLWQLHAWDAGTPVEETLAAVDSAVRSGRARYAGVSNFTGWQLAKSVEHQRGHGYP